MLIAVSGGFDPLHVGHLEYLEKAEFLGELAIVLNTDEWLIRKKGYVFMPFEERKTLLTKMFPKAKIFEARDDDGTVCASLEEINPFAFAKGGDRGYTNTPEIDLCDKMGIAVITGLGKKIQSSSTLVENAKAHNLRV